MKILFLGPECPSIFNALMFFEHSVKTTEEPINVDFLKESNFDFAISYRYRYLIKKEEIAFFKGNIINLHISLLPWNKGADPNLWSFLDNTPRGYTTWSII